MISTVAKALFFKHLFFWFIHFFVQVDEFGMLEDANTNDEIEKWDTEIDIASVNNALREVKEFYFYRIWKFQIFHTLSLIFFARNSDQIIPKTSFLISNEVYF